MASIVILGDLHLGKNLSLGKTGVGSNLNSRVVDQLNLLDWTLEQAIENVVDTIILTGDIFEEPKPNQSLIALFISWLDRCKVNDINVHIIIGNHDILRSGKEIHSSLDIIIEANFEHVTVHKSTNTIFIDTSAVTFMPFQDRKYLNCSLNSDALNILRDSLVYELASIPITYRKVLVGHLAIEGSIPIGDEFNDLQNELMCPLDMFNGYDFIWMGHVHNPQILKKKPLISHVGSMDISNFGETEEKKNIVIYNCDTGEHKLEIIPTRPLRKVSIVVPSDIDNVNEYVTDEINKLGNVFEKSIVRVDVSVPATSKSINKVSLEKLLLEKGSFNISGITESKKVNLIKKDSNNILDTQMDVLSAIKKYADLYIKDDIRSDFIDLATEIYNDYKLEAKD